MKAADRILFEKTAKGEVAYFGDGNPAKADQWGDDRVLKADRIRWLCTDPEATKKVLPHEGIKIMGARIEGRLLLSFAKLGFPLSIKKSAIPDGIVMQRARIPALFLQGTHTGPIYAAYLEVQQDLFMRKGFEAKGEVVLMGASIGGNLDCSDGHFSNPDSDALIAEGIKVEGNVFLRGNFKAEGVVDLTLSRIRGGLVWRPVEQPQRCTLYLESARVGTLWDEEASWPKQVFLDGFVYDRIDREAPIDAETRLRWINLQKAGRYLPHPYEQLATVLKEMGHEKDARRILIAKAKDPARLRAMAPLRRFGHRVLGWTIDHGYRPWKAGGWAALFLLIGMVVFAGAAGVDRFERTRAGVGPQLNVVAYSVDAFVPLIDLHQVKYWMPKPGVFRGYLWVHILAGWVLSTLMVVGLTGLVRG